MNTITKEQYDLLKKEIIDNLIGTQIGGKIRSFISINSINSWMGKAGIKLED